MSRHERTLIQIGTVLLVGMLVLRMSHYISASMAQALLVFGVLFVGSGLAGYNRRLKAENNSLRTRPDDQPTRR